MVRMRLEPTDVPPRGQEASNYNESRLQVLERRLALGGSVRMGNRPNKGYAEMTVCLYPPDGRLGFMYRRPKISGNKAHDAAGLRLEVLAPYEQHRITYDGKVCVLDHPRDMADPKAASTSNPFAPVELDLDLHRVDRPWGGEPEWGGGGRTERVRARPRRFRRGARQRHMAVSSARSRSGGETVEREDGLGIRARSWGPRFWQNISWTRWLTFNLGPRSRRRG